MLACRAGFFSINISSWRKLRISSGQHKRWSLKWDLVQWLQTWDLDQRYKPSHTLRAWEYLVIGNQIKPKSKIHVDIENKWEKMVETSSSTSACYQVLWHRKIGIANIIICCAAHLWKNLFTNFWFTTELNFLRTPNSLNITVFLTYPVNFHRSIRFAFILLIGYDTTNWYLGLEEPNYLCTFCFWGKFQSWTMESYIMKHTEVKKLW